MRDADLALFRSELCPSESLRFEGKQENGELSGGLICAGQAVVGYVESGVASFVAPNLNWPEASIAKAREEGWIPRNWERWRKKDHHPFMLDLAEEIAGRRGLVCEVACGPGGGLLPGVLACDPEAAVVLNDISVRVLQLYREFLREENIGPNVCPVAFDATRNAVRDGVLATVSSCAGFTSISDPEAAVRAAFTALEPGGCLFSFEMVADPEEWESLPPDFREKWDKVVHASWRPRFESTGFYVESSEYKSGPLMDPNEGDFPKQAHELGFRLHKHFECIRARKPDN